MIEDLPQPLWRRAAPAIAIVAVSVLIGLLLYALLGGDSDTRHRRVAPAIVKLRIIQPSIPPPPPPPPPKMEPPKMKQVEFRPLEPQPEAEPPPGPPALDAEGEGPGDSFGLAGRPGGSDYLGGGGGAGGAGSPFAWYATIVQQRTQDAIASQEQLRKVQFRVKVRLWFAADGSTERVELMESTGDQSRDRLLEETLDAMPRLPEAPPGDMPQPVVLRVSAS